MNIDAKLADIWADKAVQALATVEDPARWIVANREALAKVDQALPSAFQRVKAAIKARWDQLGNRG